MIRDCSIYECEGDLEYCILCLPGRGGDGDTIADFYAHCSGLDKCVFVGITPEGYCWYPLPRNPDDQAAAVAGIPRARGAIEEAVTIIGGKYNIPKSKTAIVGFSAGGVMAIETAAHSVEPFAAVVAHAGAILDPKSLPKSRHPTPVVLIHAKDDDCFAWDERFLPMRDALLLQGYDTFSLEHDLGGHRITEYDVRQAGLFLSGWFEIENEYPQTDILIEPCHFESAL